MIVKKEKSGWVKVKFVVICWFIEGLFGKKNWISRDKN